MLPAHPGRHRRRAMGFGLAVAAVGAFLVGCVPEDGGAGTPTTTVPTTTVPPRPVASFTATPNTGAAPLVVDFDGSASTAPPVVVSWRWDFGDGTIAPGSRVMNTFGPGVYIVRLTIADIGGSTASTTRTISVLGTMPAPTGLRPGGGSTAVWNATPGATKYILEFAPTSGFCSTFTREVAAPTTSIDPGAGCIFGSYNVRVQAYGYQSSGVWSAVVNMTNLN